MRIWTNVIIWQKRWHSLLQTEAACRRNKSQKPEIKPNTRESLGVVVRCSTNELNL